MPRLLAGVEYLQDVKRIDDRWVSTLEDVNRLALELKYSIAGFTMLLTGDDASIVRAYDKALSDAMKRPGRVEVPLDKMEGRAESYARGALYAGDVAFALYLQMLDIRAVAFKNKMWDMTNRPGNKEHQL